MYNDLISLVEEFKHVDEYGDTVADTVERTVYAKMQSISQSELYQAQAVGLRPEIKFVIADYLDYNGEKKLIFEPYFGKREEYSVIRTFRKGNELEIVCKRGVD